MKIIQFSDLHLLEYPLNGEDKHRYERLSVALKHAGRHHPDAVRLVLTGDLSDDPQSYSWLNQQLEESGFEYRLLLGNHDDRTDFHNIFLNYKPDVSGFIQASEIVEGTGLIYLDTVVDGEIYGSLDRGRMVWLDDQLEQFQLDDMQVIVFMHHNPVPVGIPEFSDDGWGLRDGCVFRALLARYRSTIAQIVFGHIHTSFSGTVSGVSVTSCPSTTIPSETAIGGSQHNSLKSDQTLYNVIQTHRNEIVVFTEGCTADCKDELSRH